MTQRNLSQPQDYQAQRTLSLAKLKRQAEQTPGPGGGSEATVELPLLEWNLKHRPFLAPGVKFDLEQHRYLEGIYQDECQRQVIIKAGQSGLSEYCISWILHGADIKQANGLYVFPTDKHVSDFSASRIGPAIEYGVSSYLAGLVKSEGSKNVDSVQLKRIRDRFIFFRGGKVQDEGLAPQLKSMSVDMLVLDEFDEMDTRAPALAKARLEHSLIAAWREISTPTYPEVGIHQEYLNSDQRTWMVKCDSCGNWQTLELSDVVLESDDLERPQVWHGGDDPYPVCRKCKNKIDRLSPGEWVIAYGGQEVHGYQVPGLACGRKNLKGIISSLASVDESKRKEATNQGLGLPYRSSGANVLTDSILDKCCRDYALGPKPGGAFCGIDVGSVLHIVIRGTDWSLRYTGERRNFDNDLIDLLRSHGVLVTAVDIEPETRAVRDFQAKMPANTLWPVDYVTGMESVDIQPMSFDTDRYMVKADRTRLLDAVRGLFTLASRGEQGGATLPLNAKDIPNYYKHMKALERKVVVDAKGNSTATYTHIAPDHFHHAEVYAYIAATWYLNKVENTDHVIYAPVRIGY